jgi:hypothetical protein
LFCSPCIAWIAVIPPAKCFKSRCALRVVGLHRVCVFCCTLITASTTTPTPFVAGFSTPPIVIHTGPPQASRAAETSETSTAPGDQGGSGPPDGANDQDGAAAAPGKEGGAALQGGGPSGAVAAAAETAGAPLPAAAAATEGVPGSSGGGKRYGPAWLWGMLSSWHKQVGCVLPPLRGDLDRSRMCAESCSPGRMVEHCVSGCMIFKPAVLALAAWLLAPAPTAALQTVLEPATSLGHERRGPLALPDIESCYNTKLLRYTPKVRPGCGSLAEFKPPVHGFSRVVSCRATGVAV